MIANGAPNELLLHIFVAVPVDVAGGGNIAPRKLRVAILDLIAESTGSFGHDLETSGYGVKNQGVAAKCFVFHAADKALGMADIACDIG